MAEEKSQEALALIEIGAQGKKHDSHVGIDSDGCAFDTMEIKQRWCFGPEMGYLGLQPIAKITVENRMFLDLYSKWRGQNRWITHLMNLDLAEANPEVQALGFEVPQATLVSRFLAEAGSQSNDSYIAFMKDAIGDVRATEFIDHIANNWTDPGYNAEPPEEIWQRIKGITEDSEVAYALKAVAWTFAVNRGVARKVVELPPFSYCRKSLEELAEKADVTVVSSTPTEALRREWSSNRIDGHTMFIGGQEVGKKHVQLAYMNGGDAEKKTITNYGNKYDDVKRLMVGDAPGDLKGAMDAHTLFFPVIPGQENKSWKTFLEEAMPKFLEGNYFGEYQLSLLSSFLDALPCTPKWVNDKAGPNDVYVPNVKTLRVPKDTYIKMATLKDKAMTHYKG